MFLPKKISKCFVPPIKCQGIKTKLIPFIAENIQWNGKGKWVEPFLGSGVVLFNIQPDRALVGDTNKHIINFYNDIKNKKIDSSITKDYLESMDIKLKKEGESFYYFVRNDFNINPDSLKFIFLNRSCFNGLMRFNSKGGFNVPFGHKNNRFRQAYITKICNQIQNISNIIKDKDWTFLVSDWKDLLIKTKKEDFVYLDPPYIGRHTDYFNSWTEKDAIELSLTAKILPCEYALSMWKENKYRSNIHLDNYWNDLNIKTYSHFYHIGSTEKYRNKMIEALAVS